MHRISTSEPVKDWIVAGTAAGVPAVSWLAELNVYLTTASLLIAIAIGLARLRRHWQRWRLPPGPAGSPER